MKIYNNLMGYEEYPNEYDGIGKGLTLSADWQDYKATITTADNFLTNNSNGSYQNVVWVGLTTTDPEKSNVNGVSFAGKGFAFDSSYTYVAKEQIYDIENKM